jgi:hypothetical protein
MGMMAGFLAGQSWATTNLAPFLHPFTTSTPVAHTSVAVRPDESELPAAAACPMAAGAVAGREGGGQAKPNSINPTAPNSVTSSSSIPQRDPMLAVPCCPSVDALPPLELTPRSNPLPPAPRPATASVEGTTQQQRSVVEQAEQLVIRQLLLLQADLSANKIRVDPTAWVNAAWLLAITLPRLPPLVANQARPLLSVWHRRAVSAGPYDEVRAKMLQVAGGSREQPIEFAAAHNCSKPIAPTAAAAGPQVDIQMLASKIASLNQAVQSMRSATIRKVNHTLCMRAASDVTKRTHDVIIELMDQCLQWHLESPTASRCVDGLGCASSFRSLARDVFRCLSKDQLLSVWLDEAARWPIDTRTAVELAVEQLLYLLTHCVYGVNFWGQRPDLLSDERGKEVIDLAVLVALISEGSVLRWLKMSCRAELLAECICVYQAADLQENVRQLWSILEELAGQSCSDGKGKGQQQAVPLLLTIDGKPLNGSARVHLVNCCLLALQNFYPVSVSAAVSAASPAAPSGQRVQVKKLPKESKKRTRLHANVPLQGEDTQTDRRSSEESIRPSAKRAKSGQKQATSASRVPPVSAPLRVSSKQFPHPLYEAVDSTSVLPSQQRQNLENDGFLLLRQTLDPSSLGSIHQLLADQLVAHPATVAKKHTQAEEDEQFKSFRQDPVVRSLTAPHSALHQVASKLLLREAEQSDVPSVAAGNREQEVSVLTQYTWPRVKPPKASTKEHADYSFFQLYSTFFADYRTDISSPTDDATTVAATRECMLCLQATPLASAAAADPADRRTLTCSLCARRCHVRCLCLQEGVTTKSGRIRAVRASAYQWHCQLCTNRPLELYTCWIPLVCLTLFCTLPALPWKGDADHCFVVVWLLACVHFTCAA